MRILSLLLLILSLQSCNNSAPEKTIDWAYWIGKANTDESKVPNYILPTLLVTNGGENVDSELMWLEKRRPELLESFQNEIYGKIPEWDGIVEFTVVKNISDAVNGKATMKEVKATFTNNGKSATMMILIFLPNKGKESHPLFIGLNFFGNHTVYSDDRITMQTGYTINKNALGVKNHSAKEAKRGVMSTRWQVENIIDKGFGLATIFYGDLDPDYDDGYKNGVQPLFYKNGQTKPADNEWGSIAVWSWGLSRAMDYFETDSQINQNKIVVIGHSRLAKAALWTGARDKRFAITISNNSGSTGAALFRREFGETIDASLAYAPQWYAGNFKKYEINIDYLSVDQHMLIALVAPRPVYIASATEDSWADPKGEFLSAKLATPAYHLFNKKGIEVDSMPKADIPIQNSIAYHIRTGKHNLTEFDWNNYIEFANNNFAKTKNVALTFDDGPDNLWTPKILDVLKENNIKATFFVVGNSVKKYPEVVKRMHNEGHLVANHTMSHPHLSYLSTMDSVLFELDSTNELLKSITGEESKTFRPPYGHLTTQQEEYLQTKGYNSVMWSIDPHDWDVKNVSEENIVEYVDTRIFDGANILLHSANASVDATKLDKSKQNTVDALPKIIRSLKNKEYEFVTVEEL